MAGLVDGEGYVAFNNSAVIQVETVTPALAYTPETLFGGSVTRRKKDDVALFRWAIYGKCAIKLLCLLLPYLRYKKPQAEVVMYSSRYPANSAMRRVHQARLKQLRKKRY